MCEGDSGGSMTFMERGLYYIRGIVSVGPATYNRSTQKTACDATHYAVFTDVAQYLPWIDKETDGCEKSVQCNVWR